jgi:hypothetical protein
MVNDVGFVMLGLIIFELCRFIPAYKKGLSRHLPVNDLPLSLVG